MPCCCCDMKADLQAAEDEISELTFDVREAIAELKRGEYSNALQRLNRIAPDPDLERERKKEEELSRLLAEWKGLATPRPDFLTFAHKKRKFSAA